MSFEDPADSYRGPYDSGSYEMDKLPHLSAASFLGGRYRLDQEISRLEPSLTWRAFDTKLHRPSYLRPGPTWSSHPCCP